MGLLKQTEGMTTMNERPTPETDAAWAAWPYAGPGVHANFARKLERERDEARAKLTHVHRWIERNHPDGFIDSQSHLQNLERVTEHIHDKMDKLEEWVAEGKRNGTRCAEERDRLQDAVRNLRDVKGRHNSGIAYERLLALLPENVQVEAREK
jgi:hypothetical protein